MVSRYPRHVRPAPPPRRASDSHLGSHLDLIRAPYFLYGVKYIDLVSLEEPVSFAHCQLDLISWPCKLDGVTFIKHIDPVSLGPASGMSAASARSSSSRTSTSPHMWGHRVRPPSRQPRSKGISCTTSQMLLPPVRNPARRWLSSKVGLALSRRTQPPQRT